MKKVLALIALFGLVSLSGCNGGDGPDGPKAPALPVTAAVNPTSSKINDDVTKRSYDVAKADSDGFIDVEVGPDDVSILVNLTTEDNSKALLVTEIRDPDDTVIYSADVDPSDGEVKSVVSDFVDTPYGDQGDTAVFLPPTPDLALKEGKYRFTILREDDNPLRRAEVFVKSVPTGEDVDLLTYSVDLNIWIAHPEPEFNSDAFKQLIETEYKDSINRILGAHSLSVGTISFFKATDAEVASYTDLDVEEGLADACRAMLAVTETKFSLNLAYVRELKRSEGGGIAGVSPSPGVLLDDGASNGCFFVSQRAYVADPSVGFTEDLANQMMAGNILHESGHFVSLEHPTEEAGDDFDHLQDTPECDAATYDGRDDPIFGVPGKKDGEVTDFECGIEGGAKNFIFYSGVPQFLPFEMSMDQAKVLRRHPLYVRQP